MKQTKLGIAAIAILLSLPAISAPSAETFDNVNVKIHNLNLTSEISKATIQKENMKSSLKQALISNNAKEEIVKNDSNIELLESRYRLKLKTIVHEVKTGKKSFDSIENGFIKKKIKSLLLMDQNQTEVLLKELEEKKETVKLLEEDIKKKVTVIKKKTEEIEKAKDASRTRIKNLQYKIEQMKYEHANALNQITEESGEETVTVEKIEEETELDIDITDIVILGYIDLPKYKKVTLDFSYSLPQTSTQKYKFRRQQVTTSKKIQVPGFGSIKIKIKDGSVYFYNGSILLAYEEYK